MNTVQFALGVAAILLGLIHWSSSLPSTKEKLGEILTSSGFSTSLVDKRIRLGMDGTVVLMASAAAISNTKFELRLEGKTNRENNNVGVLPSDVGYSARLTVNIDKAEGMILTSQEVTVGGGDRRGTEWSGVLQNKVRKYLDDNLKNAIFAAN